MLLEGEVGVSGFDAGDFSALPALGAPLLGASGQGHGRPIAVNLSPRSPFERLEIDARHVDPSDSGPPGRGQDFAVEKCSTASESDSSDPGECAISYVPPSVTCSATNNTPYSQHDYSWSLPRGCSRSLSRDHSGGCSKQPRFHHSSGDHSERILRLPGSFDHSSYPASIGQHQWIGSTPPLRGLWPGCLEPEREPLLLPLSTADGCYGTQGGGFCTLGIGQLTAGGGYDAVGGSYGTVRGGYDAVGGSYGTVRGGYGNAGNSYGTNGECGSARRTREVANKGESVARSTPGSCSTSQALLNGVNVLCGVGVLSTPFALQQSGWLGLLVMLAIATICCYTGLLLMRCMENQPGVLTYPDIGYAAYGEAGRALVAALLYTEVYCCAVEFLILEGDNLYAIFPTAALDIFGIHLEGRALFAALAAFLVLPTVYLKDLSRLSYLSACGMVAAFLVVGCVGWVGIIDGVGFAKAGRWLDITGMPVSIGLFGFCYSGHALFPSIYASMDRKRDFGMVLKASFVICTILYGGIAIMGFKMFGNDTRSQITLNLPSSLIASRLAIWTTVVNPFTKFAFATTPVANALEARLPIPPGAANHEAWSIGIRTGIVLSALTIALTVPFFGYVMAFIGSFLSIAVSVLIPCAFYLKLRGTAVATSEAFLCIGILVIGAGCAAAGTYSSVASISGSWNNGHG